MNHLYIYRLTANVGFAPCYDDDFLTLACCKPKIRYDVGKKLRSGELNSAWLLGIGGVNLKNGEANRWLYAAKVTEVIPYGKYFTDPKYQERKDCIYTIENPEDIALGDASLLRYKRNDKMDGNVKHHPKPKDWDVDWGVPDKKRSKECYVLASTQFHRFTEEEAHRLMAKHPDYTHYGRNHRKPFEPSPEFIADMEALF